MPAMRPAPYPQGGQGWKQGHATISGCRVGIGQASGRPPDAATPVYGLGCGAGIVGLVAARRAVRGHVYLLDASYAAVRLAAANARANAIANVSTIVGDALATLRAHAIRPTVFAINPPFHFGQMQTPLVAQRFIAEAAERPG